MKAVVKIDGIPQVEPNLLNDRSGVKSYKDFGTTALPDVVMMTSSTITVPVDSPMIAEERARGIRSTLRHAFSDVVEPISLARLTSIDLKRRGVEGLIQDFHFKAICNAITQNKTLHVQIPKKMSNEQVRERLIDNLTERRNEADRRVALAVSIAGGMDLALMWCTPPGTELAIGSFVVGHEFEMIRSVNSALAKSGNWKASKILASVDSRLSEVEVLTRDSSYKAALQYLDDCDTIEGNSLYVPELVPLAEIFMARVNKSETKN